MFLSEKIIYRNLFIFFHLVGELNIFHFDNCFIPCKIHTQVKAENGEIVDLLKYFLDSKLDEIKISRLFFAFFE